MCQISFTVGSEKGSPEDKAFLQMSSGQLRSICQRANIADPTVPVREDAPRRSFVFCSICIVWVLLDLSLFSFDFLASIPLALVSLDVQIVTFHPGVLVIMPCIRDRYMQSILTVSRGVQDIS